MRFIRIYHFWRKHGFTVGQSIKHAWEATK